MILASRQIWWWFGLLAILSVLMGLLRQRETDWVRVSLHSLGSPWMSTTSSSVLQEHQPSETGDEPAPSHGTDVASTLTTNSGVVVVLPATTNHHSQPPSWQGFAQLEKERIAAEYSSSSCSQIRTCPQGRFNKIFVTATNQAGLLDRGTILGALVNLAGYLCATVNVRGPRHFLHPRHNNGKKLSAGMIWEDEFASFHFYGDNTTTALKTIHNSLDSSDYDHRIRSLESEDFVKHFRQAQSLYKNATSFLWEWKPTNYYEAINTIGEYLATLPQKNNTTLPALLNWPGCQYAYKQTPNDLMALAESIWMENIVKEMGADKNVMAGYFHIRRGDSLDACDTSVSRMDRYLACSLNGTESLGPIALLFSSDETNPSYRNAIAKLVNEKKNGESPVRFFDLDALVDGRLQNEIQLSRAPPWRRNNFYLFALIQVIVKSTARFRLEQRREFSCSNCTNVRAQMERSAST